MKLSKSQLKQIVRESVTELQNESVALQQQKTINLAAIGGYTLHLGHQMIENLNNEKICENVVGENPFTELQVEAFKIATDDLIMEKRRKRKKKKQKDSGEKGKGKEGGQTGGTDKPKSTLEKIRDLNNKLNDMPFGKTLKKIVGYGGAGLIALTQGVPLLVNKIKSAAKNPEYQKSALKGLGLGALAGAGVLGVRTGFDTEKMKQQAKGSLGIKRDKARAKMKKRGEKFRQKVKDAGGKFKKDVGAEWEKTKDMTRAQYAKWKDSKEAKTSSNGSSRNDSFQYVKGSDGKVYKVKQTKGPNESYAIDAINHLINENAFSFQPKYNWQKGGGANLGTQFGPDRGQQGLPHGQGAEYEDPYRGDDASTQFNPQNFLKNIDLKDPYTLGGLGLGAAGLAYLAKKLKDKKDKKQEESLDFNLPTMDEIITLSFIGAKTIDALNENNNFKKEVPIDEQNVELGIELNAINEMINFQMAMELVKESIDVKQVLSENKKNKLNEAPLPPQAYTLLARGAVAGAPAALSKAQKLASNAYQATKKMLKKKPAEEPIEEPKKESKVNRIKATIKEMKNWLSNLEENKYKKTYINDARRVAWFVNNNLSEDYESMPARLRRKTEGAKYSRERYLAKEFIKHMSSKQLDEKLGFSAIPSDQDYSYGSKMSSGTGRASTSQKYLKSGDIDITQQGYGTPSVSVGGGDSYAFPGYKVGGTRGPIGYDASEYKDKKRFLGIGKPKKELVGKQKYGFDSYIKIPKDTPGYNNPEGARYYKGTYTTDDRYRRGEDPSRFDAMYRAIAEPSDSLRKSDYGKMDWYKK